MRMLNPPHPGAFVRTEVIEPFGLTVGAAAAALGVSRPALSSFLNGRSDLSCTTRAKPVQPRIERMMVMPKYTRSAGHLGGSATFSPIHSGRNSMMRWITVSTAPPT